MQIPKHVISVWPKKPGGISDAVVKLTIGGANSIFPVELAKGKGGLHLCLPKTDTVTAAASGANTNSPICTVTAAQSKLIKPLSREIQLFDSYVAGTGYGDAEALVALKVDDKLLLKREPDNRFDDNAIAVLDAQNRKIGYIPERDGTVAARLMDAGKYLTAKVIRLEEKGSFRQVNISICLVDF